MSIFFEKNFAENVLYWVRFRLLVYQSMRKIRNLIESKFAHSPTVEIVAEVKTKEIPTHLNINLLYFKIASFTLTSRTVLKI